MEDLLDVLKRLDGQDNDGDQMTVVREAVGIEFAVSNWRVLHGSSMFTCDVVASIGNNKHTFQYSMGIGHGRLVASGSITWTNEIVYPDNPRYQKFNAVKIKPANMTEKEWKGWRSIRDPEQMGKFLKWMQDCRIKASFVVSTPEPDDLFWSLVLDAEVALSHDDHYSMCDEYGQTPSRESEEIYRKCQAVSRFLKDSLGWGTTELLISVVGQINY